MKILIPSYKRCGMASTIDLLNGDIFKKEDIIVSTQTKKDYEDYLRTYKGKATIIYRESHCVGDNRNTLLYFAKTHGIKKAVMLDDDISAIRFINGSLTNKPEQLHTLFNKCFSIAERTGAVLWGCYPIDNSFFMKNSITISLLIGTCLGFLNTDLEFDPNFRIKEDYELTLRLMRQGKKIIRFNSFAMSARHKTRGGCFDDWKDDEIYADMLVSKYPDLCEYDKKKKRREVKLKKI